MIRFKEIILKHIKLSTNKKQNLLPRPKRLMVTKYQR